MLDPLKVQEVIHRATRLANSRKMKLIAEVLNDAVVVEKLPWGEVVVVRGEPSLMTLHLMPPMQSSTATKVRETLLTNLLHRNVGEVVGMLTGNPLRSEVEVLSPGERKLIDQLIRGLKMQL